MTHFQPVAYEWRGAVGDEELTLLHSDAFGLPTRDSEWSQQLQEHSLGWVTARSEDRLIGFVNVAWDGSSHAFILDAAVAPADQRHGIGEELIRRASGGARAAGCEWLHVDYEEALESFYIGRCGFRPTRAALLAL
jgi:ribosomal protein S18 acetylase RimI-like enzyme